VKNHIVGPLARLIRAFNVTMGLPDRSPPGLPVHKSPDIFGEATGARHRASQQVRRGTHTSTWLAYPSRPPRGTDFFFSERGDSTARPAIAICIPCPARGEYLEFGLMHLGARNSIVG